LAPEDRCHLNGLAIRDGQPAFVTALGVTDSPGGWRLIGWTPLRLFDPQREAPTLLAPGDVVCFIARS
jgi:allophanate hydrolase subunit 1